MSDKDKLELVKRSRDKAYVAARYLKQGQYDDFGALLHDAWMDKKAVAGDISNDYFDTVYSKALAAGALGGKLLGAGGGGFFIFYVNPTMRYIVADAITKDTTCKVYDFRFTESGSTIIA